MLTYTQHCDIVRGMDENVPVPPVQPAAAPAADPVAHLHDRRYLSEVADPRDLPVSWSLMLDQAADSRIDVLRRRWFGPFSVGFPFNGNALRRVIAIGLTTIDRDDALHAINDAARIARDRYNASLQQDPSRMQPIAATEDNETPPVPNGRPLFKVHRHVCNDGGWRCSEGAHLSPRYKWPRYSGDAQDRMQIVSLLIGMLIGALVVGAWWALTR